MSHKWLKMYSTPSYVSSAVVSTWKILQRSRIYLKGGGDGGNSWYERRDTFYRLYVWVCWFLLHIQDRWHESSMNECSLIFDENIFIYWKSICMTRFIFLTLFFLLSMYTLYMASISIGGEEIILWWDSDQLLFE